ncbi:unnamed protein product, partial [Amoebophrya sp. A120]|eukprot:GSA120T00012290001.1
MPMLTRWKKYAAAMLVCLQQYCHASQPQQRSQSLPNESLPLQRAECFADGSDEETGGSGCGSDLEESATEDSDDGSGIALFLRR